MGSILDLLSLFSSRMYLSSFRFSCAPSVFFLYARGFLFLAVQRAPLFLYPAFPHAPFSREPLFLRVPFYFFFFFLFLLFLGSPALVGIAIAAFDLVDKLDERFS
ncbi:uncharacterized protein BKA78DRAFT_325250 [Phyllosticta capitalensis]|uniref:uncharacterized protein n=1 Tax=Phyllosticta capitalensis TaxID=121624 RepID=UPI00312DAF8C